MSHHQSSEVILRTFSELIPVLRCFSSEFKIYFLPVGRSCGRRSRAGDFPVSRVSSCYRCVHHLLSSRRDAEPRPHMPRFTVHDDVRTTSNRGRQCFGLLRSQADA